MLISIIIVNWNVKTLLEKCLDSIARHGQGVDYEIFVVDNASSDGSQEYLRTISADSRRKISIILNKENLGFAKANNLAIRQAKGDFLFLLNPDTEIKENTLNGLVGAMKRHPKAGLVGGRIVGVDGKLQPSVRRFPTLSSQLGHLFKLHHFFPFLPPFKKYFYYDFDYTKEQEVDQLMGSFFFLRREAIEDIGLMDEGFFIWFEEVDYCRRLQNAGWHNFYTPSAEIMHYGGQSFRQVFSASKQRIFNQSALYFFQKHKPAYQGLILKLVNPIGLFLVYLGGIFKK